MKKRAIAIKYSRGAQGGYAALTTTLLVVAVTLTIVGAFTFFSLKEVAVNRLYVKAIDARYVSEGGVEDGIYRVLSGKQIGSSEVLGVGNGSTTITVTNNGTQKIVRSRGRRDTLQQSL